MSGMWRQSRYYDDEGGIQGLFVWGWVVGFDVRDVYFFPCRIWPLFLLFCFFLKLFLFVFVRLFAVCLKCQEKYNFKNNIIPRIGEHLNACSARKM